MLIGCALIAFLIFCKHTGAGVTVAGVTVACAAIGFADDYLKLLHRRRSLGLSGAGQDAAAGAGRGGARARRAQRAPAAPTSTCR